jgi:lipopolysaccharide export system protein LptA
MRTTARLWLRRLTGVLLVASVLAAAALATIRARRLKPDLPDDFSPPRAVGSESGDGAEITSTYEGLHQKESIAGKTIFILDAIRTLRLSSGWHEIKRVRLQFHHQGSPAAVLTCEAGSFNMQTRDARVTGKVHLQFPDGAFLSTESGHFDAASRRFITDAEVVFAGRGSLGRAGRAIYALTEDRVRLDEGVVIQSESGAALHTPRLDYQRKKHRIQLPDGCRVEYGSSTLVATYGMLELDDGGGPLERVELAGGVTLSSTGQAEADGEAEGWARRLVGDRDASGKWQFRATTNGPWVTFVQRLGEGFFERSLRTWQLRGVVSVDGILNMKAEQGVCLVDVPVGTPPRRAEARTARIWFVDGRATDMELHEDVILSGDDMQASGARARVSSKARLVMLHADPSGRQRATLSSGQGQVLGDQVQLFEEEGRAEARGSVQGRIEEVTLLGTEPGSEGAPLHFAAEVLNVTDDGKTYHLRENARAWQGRSLLLADEMIYRQGAESLSAFGHVRTTFPATRVDPEAEEGRDVVVIARSLDYSRELQRAVYRGRVNYSDANHILSATELVVEFNPDSSIRSIEAVGDVDMLDLATGRRMRGQRALRETQNQVVHLTGAPVQLTDEKGNVVSGASLTWDQASGRVAISGSPESQTETIYHPEEAPDSESP